MHALDSQVLYRRFLRFAMLCQDIIKSLPRTSFNKVYGNQLLRSSGSVGANYIEALEASSRKEFILKLKICRREAKESIHWFALIASSNDNLKAVLHCCDNLAKEAEEYVRIFTASILTAEKNLKLEKTVGSK